MEIVTSITNNRNKQFQTPVGSFEYYYLSPKKYSFGITQVKLSSTTNFLMVIKEKALADILTLRTDTISTQKELQAHLIENLRIDESFLKMLDYKIVINGAHA